MKRLGRLLTIATAVLLTAGWLGAESVLRKLSDELAATAKTVTPSVVELRFEGPTLTQEVRSNDGEIGRASCRERV